MIERNVLPMVYIPSRGPIEGLLQEFKIPYEIHHYASLRTPPKGWVKDKISASVRLFVNFALSFYLGIRHYRDFDLIYSNSSLVFFGVFLKGIMNKPLVWHLREFGENDYNLIFCLGRKVSGWLYSKAHFVISISNVMTEYYKNNIYDCKNIRTIYNGIDDTSIRCKLTKENKPLKICIVGGISVEKNQIQVIKAIELLSNDTHLPKFRLDIIGGGKNLYVQELQDDIRRNGVDNIVQFIGRKDIKWLYQNLADYDIGIISSKQEAFGRVTVEYMLSGVPVIASYAGANVELLEDNTTGVFFKLGDIHDLASKIATLLEKTELRQTLALNAYKKAKKAFTVRVNATNVYKIFEESVNV